jgi:hypothetical protein
MRDASAARAVNDEIARWTERKTDVDGADLQAEFASPVRASVISERELEVIFDCLPRAVLWKGFMVELVQQIRSSVGDVVFEGFWDLVANAPHPASPLDSD